MAQYGYSTTSYGAQGGAEGGGFLGGSQGGSQDSPGGKGYSEKTLRPVTIKQIIDAQQPHPDADFKIDGHDVSQITFIGQIRGISPQATNITYRLDDGTGLIEVKQWVNSDSPTAPSESLVENAYVRCWGRLKAYNNKRHVGADIIRPITDNNEIAMHLLEATYIHLYFTRGPPESLQAGGAGGGTGGMFVDQGNGANGAGGMGGTGNSNADTSKMSPAARQVFALLQNSPESNEGLHVQHIAAQLGLPSNEVFKAGDELSSMGIIYTTVDDETWAVLQN